MLLLSGCGGGSGSTDPSDTVAETTQTETQTKEDMEGRAVAAEEQEMVSETYPETMAMEETPKTGSSFLGIMHAVITGVVTESDGVTVYSFQDKLDKENIWAIPGVELGDVLVEPASGTETAILFQGDVINDSENVDFIVMLPEGEYDIKRAEGVTTQNAMSTFSVRTSSGEELIFLKDNCVIEDGALDGDSGDSVIVYYAQSREDGACYPFRIFAGG